MKKLFLIMFALLMATGCAKTPTVSSDTEIPTNDSVPKDITAETNEPFWDFDADIGEKVDTISFAKDMGSYFINLSVDVYYVDRTNSYRLDVNGDNITVRRGEDVLSSMVFNNPCVGGAPFAGINDYKGIAAEVLEMDSGNLLVVSVPFGIIEDENAQSLSVYYFDDHFVNYIGTRKGGGDFFPLTDGEITTDGDTFTVNEYVGSEREKRTVTYSVDFENILIKEVENTSKKDGALHNPQTSDEHIGIMGVVELKQPMGDYSLNVWIAFAYDEENDNYRLVTDPYQVHIKNSDGEIVSSIAFNNPYIGGSLTIDNYEDITPEVLRFDSGNLLIVRVPAGFGEDAGAQCLSVFYYDDSYVNYIGKQEYGGDFFPLIDGEITTDGDTFTVNEYVGSEREKRTVTYSVDFENILIKEVTE